MECAKLQQELRETGQACHISDILRHIMPVSEICKSRCSFKNRKDNKIYLLKQLNRRGNHKDGEKSSQILLISQWDAHS